MNTRAYIPMDFLNVPGTQLEKLPWEHEQILRRYLSMSQHICELDELYSMMVFNLENMFEKFSLQFDDRIFAKRGETVDVIQINALLCNAVSAGRTLIESMEKFDEFYISKDKSFKKNFISKAYDQYSEYKIVDFLRNYMQHGHIPIHYDEEKIYLDLSEILETTHLKMNKNLKRMLQKAKKDLLEYGVADTRLCCVPLFYKYFLLIHRLYRAFYSYAEYTLMQIGEEKRKLLQDHPEYVRQVDEIAFAPVYQDELGQLHGVAVEDGYEEKIRENITYAEEKLQEYIKGNGQICSLQIDYCLEYRIPEMILIHEEELSENLVSYCKKHGHEIRHVSFYTYYKDDMDSYTRYKMFPYIQFEESVEWNVPYDRVTIRDFLRTFPEAEEKGILVQANNMGGDGIQIAQAVLQGWKTFLYHSSQILDTLGINSLADAIDWASRVVFIYQSIGWLKESFGKRIEKKPTIEQLEEYIRRAERWELSQLSSTLHAAPELLKLVLSEVGYISQDGELFVYDEVIATQRKEEERKRKAEKENSHGTQVDCRKMNKVIEELNVTILYYASLQNEKKAEECGKETRIGKCVEQVICKYREFLWWDEVREELKVRDPLLEKFTEEIQGKICRDVRALEEELSGKCRELEKNESL